MQRNCDRDAGIRLTHLPTGVSVELRCRRNVDVPALERHARDILRAKVASLRPAEIRRTYTMAPHWAAGIRQDGRRLAEGVGAVVATLDGDLGRVTAPAPGPPA